MSCRHVICFHYFVGLFWIGNFNFIHFKSISLIKLTSKKHYLLFSGHILIGGTLKLLINSSSRNLTLQYVHKHPLSFFQNRIPNMQNRLAVPLSQENPLWISWHDTNWIPILNPTNVMDYFQEKTNPFYDRTCNNEIVKMQRLSLDQMK